MLLNDGCHLVRIKGSHYHFKHGTRQARSTVVNHKKDLRVGTVRAVSKGAGVLNRLYLS
jgi:predicted RNA binding protein YcfA (HicA-like mRNA interferase family)